MYRLQYKMLLIVVTWILIPNTTLAEPVNAGFAAIDITPPVGFRKGGGYGEVISTGVHDPLFAKIMVLKQGEIKAALVINDLLSVPADLSTQARKLASKKTGIPFSNIIVAATHNHGSPEYWGSLRDIFHDAAVAKNGKDDKESINYQQKLMDSWVRGIVDANLNAKPVTLSKLITQQENTAFNRRFHMKDGSVRFNPRRGDPNILFPAGPVDKELPFLLFKDQQTNQPVGGLTVFAMHTAVFGGKEFGADFPGHLQKKLRERFGENFISLFGEGTAGDINHVDINSKNNSDSVTISTTIGKRLGTTIISQLDRIQEIETPDLAVFNKTVNVPFQSVSKARYLEAKNQLLHQKTNGLSFLVKVAAWRDCHRYHHSKSYGSKKPLKVQVIRIDSDTAIVTLPHEIFVEIGITIKAASPFRNTIVLSLANDVDYYIPTRKAFEEGSYEVTTCPLDTGCGELLSATAIELLNTAKQNKTKKN